MSGDLIDTTEMYLKTIIELQEEDIIPMRARITERLGHSGPTVSQTIARMERDGLVVVEEDRQLSFTDEGRRRALAVMRKHRLAERLLVEFIGLDLADVHEEACRWEHVMSEAVERRIASLIKPPFVDPYGNPIPGLEVLGITDPGKDIFTGVTRLTNVVGDSDTHRSASVILRRIGEPLQADTEQLSALAGHGMIPGALVTATVIGDWVRLERPGDVVHEVSWHDAGHLFVSPADGE
ncbi:metal-dependent transcriptional regulator [Devriesea agamarum]|uniref:metal-dependent transcriptional regulator n=1 Tax=Devriesea agamarum TaxID=472569 RepID=UPI000B0E8EC8|nr:metal-dependent transcriptional regulator [Devriesea agamarum]